MKKALKPTFGLKGTTRLHDKLATKQKMHKQEQEKIDVCLNCTKPASECFGTCFGRNG
jgi:hypothetical protein